MNNTFFNERCKSKSEGCVNEDKKCKYCGHNPCTCIQHEGYNYEYGLDPITEAVQNKVRVMKSVRQGLLTEAFLHLIKSSIPGIQLENMELLERNIIENYIEDNGLENVVEACRAASVPWSDTIELIDEACDKICIFVDDKNHVIDVDEKNKFENSLKDINFDNISMAISNRVSNAINTFKKDNIELNDKIKEILTKSQEKIDGTDNQDLKEAYEENCNARINRIKEIRTKTLYESIFSNIANSVMKNDIKEYIGKNGKIDMIRLNECVKSMYTFLETLNTCNIKKIDEYYIEDLLKSL